MKKLTRQGAITEPWRTPHWTLSYFDIDWEYRKYEACHFTVLWGREEWEMAERNLGWCTMSKALERSNDIMTAQREGLG